jgi:hypothetical protein
MTLWVHRTIDVLCRVVLDPIDGRPTSPLQAVVTTVVMGSPHSTLVAPTEDPWNTRWASLHGIEEGRAGVPQEDGRFRLSVPAFRWIGVYVEPPSLYAPETFEIPIPDRSIDVVEMEVHLRRRTRISGRIRANDSAIPPSSEIFAHVLRNEAARSFNWERFESLGVGARGARQEGDRVWLQYASRATIPPDGSFALDLPVGGEIVLVVHVPGHLPERRDVSAVGGALESIEIAVRAPSRSKRTRFLFGGVPLTRWSLVVTDVSEYRIQSMCVVRLDDLGASSTEWFEPGRSYWLLPQRTGVEAQVDFGSFAASRYVLWSEDQSDIDLIDLATRIEEVPRR